MIINLKDIVMNNYIGWVYNTLLEKMQIYDTGWVDLTLLNNVQLFTEGFNIQVRRIHKTVYMRGRVTNLTEHPTTVTILPDEFRPRDGYSFRFVCPSNGGTTATFVINPNSGTLVLDNTSDGAVPAERWFSFNNIVFNTD